MEALAFDFEIRADLTAQEGAAAAARLRTAWIAQHRAALDQVPEGQQAQFAELVRRYDLASRVQVGLVPSSAGRWRLSLAPQAALAALYPEGTAAVRLFVQAEWPLALELAAAGTLRWLAVPGEAWPEGLRARGEAPSRRRVPGYIYVCVALGLLPWLVGGWMGYRAYTWIGELSETVTKMDVRLDLAASTISSQATQLARLKEEGSERLAEWQRIITKTQDLIGE